MAMPYRGEGWASSLVARSADWQAGSGNHFFRSPRVVPGEPCPPPVPSEYQRARLSHLRQRLYLGQRLGSQALVNAE